MSDFRKSILMLVVPFVCLFLVGCVDLDMIFSNSLEKNQTEEEKGDLNTEETLVKTEADEEVKEMKDEEKKTDSDDDYIGGKVFVEDEKIRVEGESNLAEGTTVSVEMYWTPFTLRRVFMNWESATVEKDGTFETELEISSDFEKEYSGTDIEVEITVSMTSMFNQPSEIRDYYGEYGENFNGPFVYQYEVLDEIYQKLYAPVYIYVGDDIKEYDIETPERVALPEDYGDPHVWIETELTNDHRFLYIHGKSNLLEGTEIKGAYYAHPDDILPQESGLDYRTYVQPDGTFFLRVGYESLTNEGILKVFSHPDLEIHDPEKLIYEAYGENFEKMSGDYVVDYEEGGKRIYFTYEPEALGVEAPEDTRLTEQDGEIKVEVPDDVLFDFDKSDLKADAQQVLEEVIDLLESLEDNTSIEINGHTDNQGDEEYNVVLSEKRAESVEAYLQENGNLDHLNISMNGYGMERPIASNEDEEGREKNRRVEIVIHP